MSDEGVINEHDILMKYISCNQSKMDAILAKRNLAKEQNTAQAAIDYKIQQMAVSSKETEFAIPVMPISGDINVSALKPLNITSIIAKRPGEITDLIGIPEGVKNLQFEKQLLAESPQLPSSIESLNLNGNYIEKIDLSNSRRLKVARINNNRLKNVGKLPESLEELYLDNNRIKRLDLDGLTRLRVLHCRNNRTLRIENIPASIVDIQVEDGNPQIVLDYEFLPSNAADDDERSAARGTESEFVEGLNDYFRLKTAYEISAKNARHLAKDRALRRGFGLNKAIKMARQTRPKCVNCKRPVGTVFKTREDRFFAYCGDTKSPCALKIEIFKGKFESDDEFADFTQKSLLETKEKIICQKMDVLFNYSSEEETVVKFKDLIEDYNLLSVLHKSDLDMREDKRFNLHKRELIKGKIKTIAEIKGKMNVFMDEYAASDNRDALHSAMDIYIREYMPEINNLRMLKYSVMEMVIPASIQDPATKVRMLNQSSASVRQLETFHGEIPKVIKYVTGVNNAPDQPRLNEDEDEDEDEDVDRVEESQGEEESRDGEEEISQQANYYDEDDRRE
jgi:hypothetical protein